MLENQIEVEGRKFEIKPIKMKYMKDGFYNYYIALKKYGLMKILKFGDGAEIVNLFLKAVFEDNIDDISFLSENLNELVMKTIIEKVKEINEIEDEDDLKNV